MTGILMKEGRGIFETYYEGGGGHVKMEVSI